MALPGRLVAEKSFGAHGRALVTEFSPNGQTLALGSETGVITLVDRTTHRIHDAVQVHSDAIFGLCWGAGDRAWLTH
jgi:hypothetical protein